MDILVGCFVHSLLVEFTPTCIPPQHRTLVAVVVKLLLVVAAARVVVVVVVVAKVAKVSAHAEVAVMRR